MIGVSVDTGVTHVALPISNLDASLAFYERFAGMKVVQRPYVHGSAGQVRAAWRLGDDRGGVGPGVSRQVGYSVKNCAMWRNFL